MRVVIVGGSVSGLGAALALARAGHEVTILERDATPLPETADDAFWWDRRGAPQVRHSHALLARLRNLLRDRYPDVLDALHDAGASDWRLIDSRPPTLVGFEAEPGDDDLVMLACRRTTFEWVLRRMALAEPGVELRDGVSVRGLAVRPGADHNSDAGRNGDTNSVRVGGVVTDDAERIDADAIVVANGRRSEVTLWLTAVGGASVPETTDDTGIVYYSRFYRLTPAAEFPPMGGPIGGDLGYLKYGVFKGDNRTFSITLACATDDHVLRTHLVDPAVFNRIASDLVVTAPWLADGRAEPITGVHAMAGLLNRLRTFVVDGTPAAERLFVVGDAAVCTNPLYGRGCALGFVHAQLAADAISEAFTTGDWQAAAMQFHADTQRELVPWYDAAVAQDRSARKVSARLLAGCDPDGDADDPDRFMRTLFREGLMPAVRVDPVVWRAFVRSFNLLTTPDALVRDADLVGRVMRVWQDRENRPPERRLGPERDELLASLTSPD